MSIILGIHDGTHNAGACIIHNGSLIAACDEERFCRIKNAGGFPNQSIRACLKISGCSESEITGVAFAGLVNPNPVLRVFRKGQQAWKLDHDQFYKSKRTFSSRASDWLQFRSPFPYLQSNRAIYSPVLRRVLGRQLKNRWSIHAPIQIFDHHRCHAASAYFGSGFSKALILVTDGLGDGLCLSVWQGAGSSLRRIGALPFPHSYGLLYASITGFLGFRPFRHEGKLTGLSACGQAKNIPLTFPFEGDFPNRRTTLRYPIHRWLKRLEGHSKEDISAWLHEGLEREIIGILQHCVRATSAENIALAGGLFANVRLNQTIARRLNPEELFIFPNMGDAGLAAGAAYLMSVAQGKQTYPFQSAFLGTDIDQEDILRTISRKRHQLSQPDLAKKAVEVLANGGIIARCSGPMEYGPRALGNRSILASAADKEVTERLNRQLGRSDFMPFAPIIRTESVAQYLQPQSNSLRAARWMTVNFQAKAELKRLCPAAVHVDGSLRPQIVNRQDQPELWNILLQYEQKTGQPMLINTSFNIHEEPIVCSIRDALKTFEAANLDAMILGNYWIHPQSRSENSS